MDLTARSLAMNEGRLIVYGASPAPAPRRARPAPSRRVPVNFPVTAPFRCDRGLTDDARPASTQASSVARTRETQRSRVPQKSARARGVGVPQAHVVHNRALGELDHPSPHSPTFRCLNSANVSHQVLDYHWSGNDLMGYVEVLPTQAGGMLRDLYIAGFQLGMSSRGWATLKEKDGYICIQDDFELITFDFVSDPSTEGAYLRPLQRTYEQLRPPSMSTPPTTPSCATVKPGKPPRVPCRQRPPPGDAAPASPRRRPRRCAPPQTSANRNTRASPRGNARDVRR